MPVVTCSDQKVSRHFETTFIETQIFLSLTKLSDNFKTIFSPITKAKYPVNLNALIKLEEYKSS